MAMLHYQVNAPQNLIRTEVLSNAPGFEGGGPVLAK
jgi:hypothetical protein